MNLTKEQLQKAALGVVLVLVALYAYFSMLLGPLGAREKRAQKAMDALAPKMKEANTQITRTRSIEAEDPFGAAAGIAREAMATRIPDGAAIVWLPQRLSEFFHSQGIKKITSKAEAEQDDLSLPGYRLSTWQVNIAEVEFVPFAAAIAAMENQEGLAQITSLRIETNAANVQFQNASLKFSTLVKK